MADKKGASGEKVLYCSFCGKSQHEVKKLIAGPSVFICDECIELCNDIIRDESPTEGATSKTSRSDLPAPAEIKGSRFSPASTICCRRRRCQASPWGRGPPLSRATLRNRFSTPV